MKTCTTCKQVLPLEAFNRKTVNKDGRERYCKECHRERNRAHYQANKPTYYVSAYAAKRRYKEWWFGYKESLKCANCDESRRWCLDFHHLDPELKIGSLSSLISSGASKDTVQKEIEKCIVLCRNCHADVHHKQLQASGKVVIRRSPKS